MGWSVAPLGHAKNKGAMLLVGLGYRLASMESVLVLQC